MPSVRYATLAMGGAESSHKNVSASRSWLLNLYYTNKVCLASFSLKDEGPRVLTGH